MTDSIDEGLRQDLMARVAWLYHVEELTQAEVAQRLGMTRRAVNETLAAAMDSGVVTVRIHAPLADCLALERALCERFGLEDAVVVPTPQDPNLVHSVLGRAAGEYLGRILPQRRPTALGVGWGQTLRQTIRYLPALAMPGLTVRSIAGGLSQGTALNTFETVRAFAERLGAECRYFTAPVYADSPQSREIILAQPVFREPYDACSSVDIALFSAGDMTGKSSLISYAMPAGSEPGLRAAGAIGDVICRFFDATGREVPHILNSQVLSPQFSEFHHIPMRIAASGGAHKHVVMRAVALGGHATVVLTDSECAMAMLQD